MNVVAVGDEAEHAIRQIQRGADHSGVASGHRPHSVIQVGKALHAGNRCSTALLIAGRGVSAKNHHPGSAELPDDFRRGFFRRKRGHRDQTRLKGGEDLHPFLVYLAEHPLGMRASALRVQKRPLQVDTQDAGYALHRSLLHGVNRRTHDVIAIADERGKKRGGPEFCVRRAHGSQRVERRRVVEQYAAPAVDLDIDESGRQAAPLHVEHGIGAAYGAVVRDQVGNQPVPDKDRAFLVHLLTGEHGGVDQGRGPFFHHFLRKYRDRVADWVSSTVAEALM